MKKVILVLLALSTVSMAAAPDLNAPAVEYTNMFETGKKGGISLKGKMTTVVPPVKYVVYSLEADGTKETEVRLKDFLIARNTDLKSGFENESENPKIVVKRVVGGVESNLLASENIKFTNKHSTAEGTTYTNNTLFVPFTLLAADEKQALITSVGNINGAPIAFDSNGYLKATDGSFYPIKSEIRVKVNADKEIEFKNYTTNWASSTFFPEEASARLEQFFAGGREIRNDYKLVIKIEG
ncbi:hypothetical protein [Cetobacterium sp.]|uniref:hypothetical protein n=1 Tax=Cetobacterium sp. TaxID=2071632 RepID=UPI003F3131ED